MLELKVVKGELLKGVSRTQSIAEKRSSMPILSNILLQVEEDKFAITATDLEISFKGIYKAEIVSPGRLTVPARKLYEIIHEMSNENLSLKESDSFNLSITGSRSNYQLHGLSAEDFPPMPDYEQIKSILINSEILKDMIDKTIYSVTTEETRYILGGVYVEHIIDHSKNTLRFTSTDGHRLSLVDSKVEGLENLELEKGVIISRKGLAEMRKLADEGGELKLAFTSNSAVLIKDEAVLVMRLLEGRFPDYNLVIPKNNVKIMTLSRTGFLEALRRISVMSTERYKGTKFIVRPKNLTLTAVNPDLGEAQEDLLAEYEEEEITMGFNVRYFIETLSTLRSDVVSLAFNGPKSPCLIKGDEDKGFIGVIMPMKV
ncbi:MAG: DNA polymerase III subunit beta [Deltaproteobacteria bacterium]|nr:DNA polymerase III subunit beta [Deltaproteobacteria bacterium]MBW2085198.1 DNA polymerase III subunit beta [Deltaproteobacteria bacterium]